MGARLRTAVAGATVMAANAIGVWAAPMAAANTYDCVNYRSRGHQVGYWTAGEGDGSGLGLSAYLTVAREEVCDEVHSGYNYNTAQIQQQNEFPSGAVNYSSAGIIRHYGELTFAFVNGDELGGYRIHRSPSSVSVGSRLCTRLLPTIGSNGNNALSPVVFDSTCKTSLVDIGVFTMYEGPYQDLWFASASFLTSDVPGTPTAKTHFYAMGVGVPGSNPVQYKSYPPILFGYNENASHWAYDADSATSIYMWTYRE